MFRDGHGRKTATRDLLFLVGHWLTVAWNKHLTKPALFDQAVAAQGPTLILASQQLHHVFPEDSGMLSSEMLGATIASAVLMAGLASLTGMGGSWSQTSEKFPESDRCRLGVALWSRPLVSEVISLEESISGSYHPS